ncbi:hypothetical protein HMPREF1979_00835 [Actinomyces johnsonii F0542]|uniref:Uncharacterized protein n=1 Tax=Actinomyces johnsonii F0542 TaxID=1321818 RepID=U1QB95_9ACTO|nr:hypothetical protein HMPREF1979_00835 [Actinomyces johnsonii F0542]
MSIGSTTARPPPLHDPWTLLEDVEVGSTVVRVRAVRFTSVQ